ncbi:MAG: rRNA pseudouridine synthase, partial [Chryseobacterium sp.]
MSRDNNSSGRPKKPRSSTRNSDSPRASKSGNSGSDSFKKSFPKAGERNSDSRRTGDNSYQARIDKKFSKTEQEPFITSSSEDKKAFGKSATNSRGGSRPKSSDTRDKYERGSLKYGRRPGAERTDEDRDKVRSFVQQRRFKKVE